MFVLLYCKPKARGGRRLYKRWFRIANDCIKQVVVNDVNQGVRCWQIGWHKMTRFSSVIDIDGRRTQVTVDHGTV